jgi:hypothetical protein
VAVAGVVARREQQQVVAVRAQRRFEAQQQILQERVPPAGPPVVGVPDQPDHRRLLPRQRSRRFVGGEIELPRDALDAFARRRTDRGGAVEHPRHGGDGNPAELRDFAGGDHGNLRLCNRLHS